QHLDRLRIGTGQLELLGAAPRLAQEPLLGALQREPVLVEQPLDAQDQLDVTLPVHPLPGVVLPGSEQLELRLPVAQDVRRHRGELGPLPDPEEELGGDRDVPARRAHGRSYCWFTCALSPLDGLKVRTRRAVISISSPVCGLRPLREDFLRTRKCPKPTIFTSLACSKALSIWSNTASTTAADWRLDSPWAATALMRSFLVSRATPLRRHGVGDPGPIRLAAVHDCRRVAPPRWIRSTTPSRPPARRRPLGPAPMLLSARG